MARWSNKNLAQTVAGAARGSPRRMPCLSPYLEHSWLVGEWGSRRKALCCHRCGKSRKELQETPERKALRLAAGGWIDHRGKPLPQAQRALLERLDAAGKQLVYLGDRVYASRNFQALRDKGLIDIMGWPTRQGRLALAAVDPIATMSLEAVLNRCVDR